MAVAAAYRLFSIWLPIAPHIQPLVSDLWTCLPGLQKSCPIIIDAQNTYREGVMKLEGVEAALAECKVLLDRFRSAQRPIFHIQHDAGSGSPYDLENEHGQIADIVAPKNNEVVCVKNYPNAFAATTLDQQLKAQGIENVILSGFMTHMCINSTARGAFSLGYTPTVVASTTATRALPSALTGQNIPAETVHVTALTALSDLVASVVPGVEDVPD